ncbi:hypothetical protein DIPPA_13096 [Diplonema papillatum]|nr:hypothetical protein DIPPA_13096 [Diplonema papillatum]
MVPTLSPFFCCVVTARLVHRWPCGSLALASARYLWSNLDNERLYIQQLFSHDASLDDDVSRNLAYQGPQTLPKAAVALMLEKLADRGVDKAFFLRAVGVLREAEEAGYRH